MEESNPGPALDLSDILQHLSERGHLEWELAVQKAINVKLQKDLNLAQASADTPIE